MQLAFLVDVQLPEVGIPRLNANVAKFNKFCGSYWAYFGLPARIPILSGIKIF